jgi:hypothetical protein
VPAAPACSDLDAIRGESMSLSAGILLRLFRSADSARPPGSSREGAGASEAVTVTRRARVVRWSLARSPPSSLGAG